MRAEGKVKRVVAELTDSTATLYLCRYFPVRDDALRRPRYFGVIPAIALWESPFIGLNAALKRLFDIVFASVALILISPILLAFAIAIKISSPDRSFIHSSDTACAASLSKFSNSEL
jgi:putative colanic acid biosynthesis UDP-glucose lipid carrier transferase